MNIKPLKRHRIFEKMASTGTLTSGTLVPVVNDHTAANRVTVVGAVTSSVVIPPNTGVIIEKE